MKILDIRGNLVKIESNKPIQVSSLLKLSDMNGSYLAQVLYAEQSTNSNVVFAKVLSYFTTPLEPAEITNISKDSVCEKVCFTDVIKNFGENPAVILGQLAYDNAMPTADKDFFDKKLLIVSENNKHSDLLINNFTHQIKNLGHNTLIFDTEGSCDGVKLSAGIDFKLPLNRHAIDFIYEKYFSDITDASKALISDIFNELKEYASSIPYIPFNTFKTVIDSVLDYSQNLSLYFFKTKLEKLYEANIFANTHEEVMDWTSINEFGPGTIVIDLSHVGKLFVREYISLVLNAFKATDTKLYAFIKLEDSFSDKDFLKEIIENDNIAASCIVRSDYKYLAALKQNYGSFVVTGGIKKSDNFDYCKFLLKNLPSDKYIITGNYTAPLSLIFQSREIQEVIPQPEHLSETNSQEPQVFDEETLEDNLAISEYEAIPEENTAEPEEISVPIADYEPIETISEETSENEIVEAPIEEIEDAPVQPIEEIPDTDNQVVFEEVSVEETMPELTDVPLEELMVSENVVIEEVSDIEENPSESIIEPEFAELPEETGMPEYAPIEETSNNSEEEEEELPIIEDEVLEELPIQEETEEFSLSEPDIIEPEEEKTPEELLDEQIRRDVDRVYMAPPHQEETEELSDEDLDFIEELVESEELVVEDEVPVLEEINEDIQVIDESEELLPIGYQDAPQEELPEPIAEQEDESFIPTRNTATPAVPIYAAEIPQDAIVQSDPIQQGDRVIHVKFGIGVVEKMFSYGTKNFCSINFENIGRKVLDPNVTELKKA